MVQIVATVFISVVFGVSMVAKMLDFKAAALDVGVFLSGLPSDAASGLAALLIAAEAASLVCIWVLLGHRMAAVPAAVLMALFTLVATRKQLRGDSGCRCFGRLSSGSDLRSRAGANAVGLLICVGGVVRLWTPRTLGDVVVQATLGLAAGLLSVFIDRVLSGFTRG